MVEAASGNRGAQRRDRTRAALLAAAREVFAQRGVDATPVQDITDAADVAKGSFYNHFDSKEALLRAVVEETLADLGRALNRLTEPLLDDPARVLSVSIRHTLRACVDDPTLGWFMLRATDAFAAGESALGALGRRDLRRGVRARRFRVDDVDLMLTIVGGAMQAVLYRRLRGELKPRADAALAKQVLRLLGVPAPEARAISSEKLPPLARSAQ